MDNETTGGVGATNPEPATVEGDSFLRAFGGDSSPVIDEAPAPAEPEADQQKEAEAEAPKQESEHEYTVKYKGKEQTVTRTDAQLIADIQKAMDYDAVKTERDNLRNASARLEDMKAVLAHHAKENDMEFDDYLDFLKGEIGGADEIEGIRNEFGDIPEAAAKELLAARKEAAQRRAEAESDAKIQAELDALKAEYPDADINALPDDVVAAIEEGMTPLEAMRLHELRELRSNMAARDAEIAALKKEKDNHFRSTGRAESKNPDAAASPFLKGFMGGG